MPIDRNSAQYITGAIYKPTQTSAPGVWDLDDQANNIAKNLWPLPPQAVQRSLRFNVADNAYLSRTPAVAGNRRTWTWSGWIKRGLLGSVRTLISSNGTNDNTLFQFEFNGDALRLAGSATQWAVTTSLYRDPSAWYHIILATDTTQATASDRFKIYVNGVLVTSYSATSYPSQNADLGINDTRAQYIGEYWNTSPSFDGYMAEINFIDGQALTPASFGETDPQTGVWIPKRYTGTYGINGFRLSFANNSSTTALGYDSSGQGNNWTANNFSVTPGAGNDVLLDVPSLYGTDTGLGGEVLGNYATLNPLDVQSTVTLSNGNLDVSGGDNIRATIACPTTGKWYFEYTKTNATNAGNLGHVGIFALTCTATQSLANGTMLYRADGGLYENNVLQSITYASYTTGDVIGVAIDCDAGNISYYKNGVLQGTRTFVAQIAASQAIPAGRNNSGQTSTFNFGQRPFVYTAPTGYKALCTTNLPAPAIGQTSSNQADNHFAAITYTGNGGTQTISTLDFQPDLIWIKRRDSNWSHAVYDSIRGAGSLKALSTNSADAEGVFNADTTYGYLSSFNNNGFTVVNGSTGGYTNLNNATYVAWCWNAGGTTVTNTSGTITSQVRANQRAGFSIVTYTGTGANATVGHGLSSAPQFLIVRNRDTVYNWRVWHTALSGTQLLYFNTTDSTVTDATMWNSAIPTSSVFSVGTNGGVNESTKRIIAYCWSEIPGYSAFGKYDAGSNTNPFIYTGFKPAFVMIKSYSGAYDQAYASWTIYDNKRNPTNKATNPLFANLSAAEGARGNGSSQPNVLDIDLLSNGFKILVSATEINYGLYVYAAFAETPARLSTAR